MTQIGCTEDGLVFMMIDTMVEDKPMKTVITWNAEVAVNVANDLIKMAKVVENQRVMRQ